MRVAILSCGAIVVREKDQSWLFGAPEGIREALDATGIDVPPVVFTTQLRSPGYTKLGAVMRFKELPLTMNGMSAKPITHKHGTDYEINAGHARLLFSERGDVSAEDVEGYHLAIIKNKHRSDKFADTVLSWPWPNTEYLIQDNVVTPIDTQLKVWSSMDDVPENKKSLEDVPLSLEQANFLARVATASGEDGKENWAIAYTQFKKSYEKKDDKWVKREEPETAEKETVNQLLQALTYALNKQFEELKQSSNGYACYVSDANPMTNTAYISHNGSNYGVPYTMTEDGVVFDDRANWIPVTSDWKPVNQPHGETVQAYMGEVDKEYAGDRPIPRIEDIITAALHKAYNDTSDKLFANGYLSQDERLKIANSIGDGLTAFRNAIQNEEFATRAVDKWDADQLIQINKDTWLSVFKAKDDKWRWMSVTSVATWDRQGELLTTKAMDWAIAFSKVLSKMNGRSTYGPLRYKHIPGWDGGDCDAQWRIGDALFETGTFRDNKIGLAMRKMLKEDPSIWQISPGLAFAKHDLVNGVYKRAAIFERSMTQRPANPFTIIIHKDTDEVNMKVLTEVELKQAMDEVNQYLAEPIEFNEVKTMYERALAAGSGPLGLKEFTEVVHKATGTNSSGFPGGANSSHKNRQEEEGETDMLKEALEDLSEEELKHLIGMVEDTYKEKGKMPPWLDKGSDGEDEDEEEDEEEDEKPMKKKGKSSDAQPADTRITALEKALERQGQLILEQTKAMGMLTQALAGQGGRENVEDAVANMFSQMPRRQANGFVSQTRTKQQELPDDDAMLQRFAQIVEKQLTDHQSAQGRGLYDMFTSPRLNQQKGGRR